MKNRGFTIIEVLIYISISTMLLFALSSFIVSILETRERSKMISEVEKQGIYIMEVMTRNVREAQTINNPEVGNFSESLSLNLTEAEKNPTIFNLEDGKIIFQQGSNPPMDLHNNLITIEDLKFTNLSRPDTPGIVQIQFTLKYNYLTNRPIYNYEKKFQSSVSLR